MADEKSDGDSWSLRRPMRPVYGTGQDLRPGEDADPAAEAAFAGVDARSMVDQIWPHLTDEQRELFVMSAEGYSYSQIAEHLGVANGTVMSRLWRARERARRVMEEGGSS